MRRFLPPAWTLMLAPIVVSAGVRGFWDPDEPRYAEVAREAVSGGGRWVMSLCGEPYPDKPPLLFWTVGLLDRAMRGSELGMRLPSILATLGSALLVARLARRWWGEREQRWAPVLYLSFAMVAEIGGRLQLDPLMAFLVLAALASAPEGPEGEHESRRRMHLVGLFAGLAALVKGPVAPLIVALVLAAWRWTGRSDARPSLAGWRGATALALAPVVGWALRASWLEPSLLRELFYRQHLGRVVADDAPHDGPWWKPAARLLAFLLPWTPIVSCALVRGSRALRQGTDPALARCTAWFAVLLVFFSAVPSKRDLYLLPAYPALALAAARWLAERIASRDRPGRLERSMAGALTALALGVLLVGVFHERLDPALAATIPDLHWRAAAIGLPVFCLAACALRRELSCEGWARAMSAATLALWLGVAIWLLPPLDLVKSPSHLAREVAARPERPETVPCLGVRPAGYRFYGGLPAVSGGLADAIARQGDLLALITVEEWPRLCEQQRIALRVLEERRVGSRRILVCGRDETWQASR